jgi:hypothetical protein
MPPAVHLGLNFFPQLSPNWVDPGIGSLDMPTPGEDVARYAVAAFLDAENQNHRRRSGTRSAAATSKPCRRSHGHRRRDQHKRRERSAKKKCSVFTILRRA